MFLFWVFQGVNILVAIWVFIRKNTPAPSDVGTVLVARSTV